MNVRPFFFTQLTKTTPARVFFLVQILHSVVIAATDVYIYDNVYIFFHCTNLWVISVEMVSNYSLGNLAVTFLRRIPNFVEENNQLTFHRATINAQIMGMIRLEFSMRSAMQTQS